MATERTSIECRPPNARLIYTNTNGFYAQHTLQRNKRAHKQRMKGGKKNLLLSFPHPWHNNDHSKFSSLYDAMFGDAICSPFAPSISWWLLAQRTRLLWCCFLRRSTLTALFALIVVFARAVHLLSSHPNHGWCFRQGVEITWCCVFVCAIKPPNSQWKSFE